MFCEDRYTEKTEQICYLQTTTEWGGTRGQIVGLIEVNLQHFKQFQLGLCFERLRDYLSLKMNLYKYIYTPKERLAEKAEQICNL